MMNAVPKEYSRGVSETGDVFCVTAEWELIGRSHLNTLLIGPPALTRHLVDSLGPQLATPVVRVPAHERITFPADDQVGTVILHDIDELELTDQLRLVDWLDSAATRPRVISTAPRPIIPKVIEGTFLPVLYYRLNLFYVDVVVAAGSGVTPSSFM